MTIRNCMSLLAIVALLSCQRDQPTQASQPAADLRLRFGQAPFALTMGAWMRLSVTLVDGQGDTTDAPASISIVSRNPAVIRVDSGTKLQSTGQGSAWIVARLDTAGQTITDSLNVDVACTLELVKVAKPAAETLSVGQSP